MAYIVDYELKNDYTQNSGFLGILNQLFEIIYI